MYLVVTDILRWNSFLTHSLKMAAVIPGITGRKTDTQEAKNPIPDGEVSGEGQAWWEMGTPRGHVFNRKHKTGKEPDEVGHRAHP